MACDWSRTPHARSLCIIVNFLTIAWGTQILGIDSHVRSYDRRTVSVEWSLRRANCKRFTHKRSTDGSVSRTVGCSLERRTQWRCMSDAHVQRSSVSKPFFLANFEFSLFVGRPRTKHPQHKTPQLSTAFEASPPSSRLGTDCFTSKLTRMSNVRVSFRIRPKNMRLTSHCRAESRAAQARLATLFAFHGAVQIIARSSPTHCLERRLVRFLRLHRATLCCADFRV